MEAITPDLFWHSLKILITKPHVVNKRLWGCKVLRHYKCGVGSKAWNLSFTPLQLENTASVDEYFNNLLQHMEIQILNYNEDTNVDTEVILSELLPRSYSENHAFQLVVLKRKENSVTFYDVTPETHEQNLCPNFPYSVHLQNYEIELVANSDVNSKSYQWLITTVLPQVIKWSQESKQQQPVCKSLSLVPHDLYYVRYNNLKEKYGKELVKIWPECTDPSKFVYEDIAIATYLLLLWEKKQDNDIVAKPQSFVDMGCGNGLLVYILAMEGHHGYGIDVRKRKIWSLYPSNIKLIEETITPSNINKFTEVDWVIGNHSDELTPWIPVIAAKSSYKCNFFLLPCCAYNFDGTKYQRQNSAKSQYTEYLEHIQKLCNDCGFETCIDRLKIPSTKRICLIGSKRKYLEEEYNKYSESIDMIVNSSVSTSPNKNTNATDNFKARESTEKVRNCTKIDRSVIDSIIMSVAKYLLEGCNMESNWSAGNTAEFSEIIPLLSQDTLKVLKSECGGLQTLLKNNHQIFEVKNGKIQLRYPRTVEETNNIINGKKLKTNVKLQVKQCWFYNNHPQGCPLSDAQCSFLHSKS